MINTRKARRFLVRHLHFVGPGLVSSVAYIDPGNWATDLGAGASYGYKLLFIVLVAGLAAVVLQLLAVRLGAVTSTSLAAQTRLLFLRLETRYPRYRIFFKACLYSLYALAEIAIVGTDLAELLGSAIALNLLFPSLPLFAGVLITAADVLIILVFFRSSSGRQGMLFFEIVIVSLVIAVFASFMVLLHLIKPEWKEVFYGVVPSSTLVEPGALYLGVGIIGATVMPHALFLGSSLASVDRLNMLPVPPTAPRPKSFHLPRLLRLPLRRRGPPRNRHGDEIELATQPASQDSTPGMLGLERLDSSPTSKDLLDLGNGGSSAGTSSDTVNKGYEAAMKAYEAEIRAFDRIAWVDVHLLHSTIDTTLSLLGFALTINAAILTLAGAAYFYGDTGATADDATLDGAFELIKGYLGNAAAIIFALALLCSGQSASITATLAGQVVSEGFIQWRTSPFVRRLITRLIGVIPAAVVAAAVGPQGLNTMLVASQVLLSVVLPTVILPLVYLCSKEDIMTVEGPGVERDGETTSPAERRTMFAESSEGIEDLPLSDRTSFPTQAGSLDTADQASPASPTFGITPLSPRLDIPHEASDRLPVTTTAAARRTKSYKSPRWITMLGYVLFGVVIIANCYVIVQLAMGND